MQHGSHQFPMNPLFWRIFHGDIFCKVKVEVPLFLLQWYTNNIHKIICWPNQKRPDVYIYLILTNKLQYTNLHISKHKTILKESTAKTSSLLATTTTTLWPPWERFVWVLLDFEVVAHHWYGNPSVAPLPGPSGKLTNETWDESWPGHIAVAAAASCDDQWLWLLSFFYARFMHFCQVFLV